MNALGPAAGGTAARSANEDAPERAIANDIARRSLYVSPVWVAICGIAWGAGGAASAAYGIVLVVANLVAAAAIMTWAVRISPVALMAASLGGFVGRLAVLFGAVLAVSGLSLFEPIPLGMTIGVSHLGLLVWEMRYVSLSLSSPGVVPKRSSRRSAGPRGPEADEFEKESM